MILHTFGDICDFLESGIWKSGNLEIAWNWLILTNFNVLGIFPTQFLSQNLILSSEFQNSSFPEIFPEIFWKSGKSLELAFQGQFQHIGYHSHSVLVTEIDFELRISKFQFSRNIPEIFWKSGNALEFAFSSQFRHIGHHSHSVLVTEIDFELRISKFQFSRNFSRIFLEIWKFSGICFFGPISTYWVSFQLSFGH